MEPEEYPLYSPPKRIGCSALAILPVFLVAVFVFLLFRITPHVAQGMINPIRQMLNIETPTPEPTSAPSGTGSIATVTIQPPTATIVVETPTPVPVPPTPTTMVEEYVEVANTGGQGVRLRAEPRVDADRVDGLAEGTVCKIIGPDTTNSDGTWRHVEVVGKNEQGWILNKWLIASEKPTP